MRAALVEGGPGGGTASWRERTLAMPASVARQRSDETIRWLNTIGGSDTKHCAVASALSDLTDCKALSELTGLMLASLSGMHALAPAEQTPRATLSDNLGRLAALGVVPVVDIDRTVALVCDGNETITRALCDLLREQWVECDIAPKPLDQSDPPAVVACDIAPKPLDQSDPPAVVALELGQLSESPPPRMGDRGAGFGALDVSEDEAMARLGALLRADAAFESEPSTTGVSDGATRLEALRTNHDGLQQIKYRLAALLRGPGIDCTLDQERVAAPAPPASRALWPWLGDDDGDEDEDKPASNGESSDGEPGPSSVALRNPLETPSDGKVSAASAQAQTRALQKHLLSWLRRMDVVKADLADAAWWEEGALFGHFKDGVVIAHVIQKIVGRKILGGVDLRPASRVEAISNITRGFQALWCWQSSLGLGLDAEGAQRRSSDVGFCPESIVKGNQANLWLCLHHIYKLHLWAKGNASALEKRLGSTFTMQTSRRVLRLQKIFEAILNASSAELEPVISKWMDGMPIASKVRKRGNRLLDNNLRNGTTLCQLVSLFDPQALYTSPTLDSLNPVSAFDNNCMALMVIERHLIERLGKHKMISLKTAPLEITDGSEDAIWRTLATVKFLFDVAEDAAKGGAAKQTNGSAAFVYSSTQKGPHQLEQLDTFERSIMIWLSQKGLIKREGAKDDFSSLLPRLQSGVLFQEIASVLTGDPLSAVIKKPKTQAVKSANITKVCHHLSGLSNFSKRFLFKQAVLEAGDRATWLGLIGDMWRYHANLVPVRTPVAERVGRYTPLGRRQSRQTAIPPNHPTGTPASASLSLSGQATRAPEGRAGPGSKIRGHSMIDYERLLAWASTWFWIPKYASLGSTFRDGVRLAKLIRHIERGPEIEGILWNPDSHTSIKVSPSPRACMRVLLHLFLSLTRPHPRTTLIAYSSIYLSAVR